MSCRLAVLRVWFITSGRTRLQTTRRGSLLLGTCLRDSLTIFEGSETGDKAVLNHEIEDEVTVNEFGGTPYARADSSDDDDSVALSEHILDLKRFIDGLFPQRRVELRNTS